MKFKQKVRKVFKPIFPTLLWAIGLSFTAVGVAEVRIKGYDEILIIALDLIVGKFFLSAAHDETFHPTHRATKRGKGK